MCLKFTPIVFPPPADDFIDVILGNRVYLKCIYVSEEYVNHVETEPSDIGNLYHWANRIWA